MNQSITFENEKPKKPDPGQNTLKNSPLISNKRKFSSSMPDLRRVKKIKREIFFTKLRRSSGSEFDSLIEYEIEKLFDEPDSIVDAVGNNLSGDFDDRNVVTKEDYEFLNRLKGLSLVAK